MKDYNEIIKELKRLLEKNPRNILNEVIRETLLDHSKDIRTIKSFLQLTSMDYGYVADIYLNRDINVSDFYERYKYEIGYLLISENLQVVDIVGEHAYKNDPLILNDCSIKANLLYYAFARVTTILYKFLFEDDESLLLEYEKIQDEIKKENDNR